MTDTLSAAATATVFDAAVRLKTAGASVTVDGELLIASHQGITVTLIGLHGYGLNGSYRAADGTSGMVFCLSTALRRLGLG
jgi:hypothetical protein